VRPKIASGQTQRYRPADSLNRAFGSVATGHSTLRNLPPYSPDFNLIENAFAELKAILREGAARSIDALRDAIADALPAFMTDECANYVAATGYEPE
jgi:hypothetical protein